MILVNNSNYQCINIRCIGRFAKNLARGSYTEIHHKH